jgi:preprotein translocase subunit SecA
MNIGMVQDRVMSLAVKQYEEKIAKAKKNGIDFGEIERVMLLRVVDRLLENHIDPWTCCARAIGLRDNGQRDPVDGIPPRRFEMFDDMVESIRARRPSTSQADVDRMIQQVADRRFRGLSRSAEADAARR